METHEKKADEYLNQDKLLRFQFWATLRLPFDYAQGKQPQIFVYLATTPLVGELAETKDVAIHQKLFTPFSNKL